MGVLKLYPSWRIVTESVHEYLDEVARQFHASMEQSIDYVDGSQTRPTKEMKHRRMDTITLKKIARDGKGVESQSTKSLGKHSCKKYQALRVKSLPC